MPRFDRVTPEAPDVAEVIDRHFALMRAQSPPESCHVLPAAALAAPDIRLFALREEGVAVAVGALRVEEPIGEIKSMHVVQAQRGKGLGRAMLEGLIAEAREIGLARLYLETGSGPEHDAARGLYAAAGFEICAPFGDYTADPLSAFMTRAI